MHFPITKKQKDIIDTSIQELKKMTAEQVLEEYRMVIYTPEDLIQINEGLELIREVLKKNSEKLEG